MMARRTIEALSKKDTEISELRSDLAKLQEKALRSMEAARSTGQTEALQSQLNEKDKQIAKLQERDGETAGAAASASNSTGVDECGGGWSCAGTSSSAQAAWCACVAKYRWCYEVRAIASFARDWWIWCSSYTSSSAATTTACCDWGYAHFD